MTQLLDRPVHLRGDRGLSGSVVLLISPAPIDGYPPVQHQARLLAAAGYDVEVITTPLAWSDGSIEFSHFGVAIRAIPLRGKGVTSPARRTFDLVSAIARARRRHAGSSIVEIAYDPMGMLVSDLAPFRPRSRIAHFHETMQRYPAVWLERRLRSAIRGYQMVVVADSARAPQLCGQLELRTSPVAVPNYPLADGASVDLLDRRGVDGSSFDVVYCGAIGTNQKLDFVIASVPQWPAQAVLVIIGNDETEIARRLKAQAAEAGIAHRVRFEGWLAYEQVLGRLARCDLGILLLDPSFEQFRTALGASNKRYQYMQAGLPQIGDMNPGVRELLDDQGIGRCLSAYDPAELAAIVREYAASPSLCAEQGRRARLLHQTRYNYQLAFEPVMRWIASRSRAPHAISGGVNNVSVNEQSTG